MKSVFLSDAHLFNEDENGYKNLLEFLSSIGDDVDELYIVGDFFDFWFCDSDRVYPGFRVMIDRLLEIKNKGVAISLFEGNHDFFLEDFFCRYGIDVYPEDATMKFDGMRLFVAHGDTVDTSNKRYLLLRRLLRSRAFYHLQSILPCRALWKIAEITSKISKEHLAEPPEGMADKMEAFSHAKFKDGFDAVILGHCHQPQIKQVLVKGRMRTFVTLGDWISHFSYLLYDNGEFSMRNYS
ncbi:MAG: UDP-2,3-diacylglucosamine diphosphatase [Deltaproteobacteria bacterium]|nr:UDP-2,3-diacylglucosamine diphosphatase [Deltaproteobacteria bacterium]